MDLLPRFTQPRITQGASRLVHLPPELLLRVLRLLLKHPGSLKPLDIEDSPNPDTADGHVPVVELSAQLLATCQLLHDEAWPILYGENTLRIVCQSVLPHYHSCYVLGAGIELHCNADDMPAGDYNLLSLSQPHVRSCHLTDRFVRYYDGLSRVQNVELVVGHSLAEELFIACRAIHPLVRGKNVLIKLLPKSTRSLLENYEASAIQCLESYRLKGCRIFRCRSIEFEGNKSDVSALVGEIEGSTDPPRDMFPLWQEAEEYIMAMPPVDESEVNLPSHLQGTSFAYNRSMAKNAVQAYDVYNAQEYIMDSVNQASELIEIWKESQSARTRERYKIELAGLEERGKSILSSLEATASGPDYSMDESEG